MDKYELDPDKDVLFRGEFEVVKELMAALPDGAVIVSTLSLKFSVWPLKNMQRKPTTYFSPTSADPSILHFFEKQNDSFLSFSKAIDHECPHTIL